MTTSYTASILDFIATAVGTLNRIEKQYDEVVERGDSEMSNRTHFDLHSSNASLRNSALHRLFCKADSIITFINLDGVKQIEAFRRAFALQQVPTLITS